MRLEVINKAYKEHQIIGLRTKKLKWGETNIGYITEINETSFIINEVDIYGVFIGYTEILLDDVIDITINDQYQNNLEKLIAHNTSYDSNKTITIWKKGDTLIPYLSDFVGKDKEVVTLLTAEGELTGIVLNVEEGYVELSYIEDNCRLNGRTYQSIQSLIGLTYNGIIEQRIKFL